MSSAIQRVILQWRHAHSSFRDNKRAGMLAQEGAQKTQINIPLAIMRLNHHKGLIQRRKLHAYTFPSPFPPILSFEN
ncbi:hypothetical protein ACOMHN_062523 [Nucella lapillus]